MKKRIMLVQLVVLGICALSAFAAPAQNARFSAPQIGAAIVCDGDLTDWSGNHSYESLPFIPWDGTGLPGTTTTAKFAWSDAADMLYVAIETDESSAQVGGHAVIGMTLDNTSRPNTDGRSTQLAFNAGPGNSVNIINEIAAYGLIPTEGIVGVQAGQSVISGVTTYEIAIPLWTDWSVMTNKQPLSAGSVIYLYSVMQDQFLTANGTNLTYDGNPAFYDGAWAEGTEITLVTVMPTPVCGDAGHLNPLYDLTGDCRVNFADFALFAEQWMKCTRPDCD